MAKVTIIIPVYNAEKYLEECLVSALNQTLADIEVVIINDCSPDGSELIIIEFLQKDSRIKYMRHECNQGQAMARNTGLKVANGEYICFLDADDKLEVNGLEHLYDLASRDDLDILEGNYIAFDSSGNLKAFAEFSRAGEVFKGREVFEIAYNERFFFTMPVWRRLWKRKFLLKTDFASPT